MLAPTPEFVFIYSYPFSLIVEFNCNFLCPQIHKVGDTTCSHHNNSSSLDISGLSLVRSNIIRPSSSQRAISHWDKRRNWISNVCTWSDTNVCCRVELYQLLCAMYCTRWNLLQVNFWVVNFYKLNVDFGDGTACHSYGYFWSLQKYDE